MADAAMERSLAAAIDSSAAATAGTLIWLVPPQYQHHVFQEHEPTAHHVVPDYDDDGHIAGDVVAALLDEFIPRDSDLDERILEHPTVHQLLLLAMASLQQEFIDLQTIGQQLEAAAAAGEAYRNGGFGAVPAATAAVAGLGKRTFHAGVGDADQGSGSTACTTTCSVCLEDLEDGEEVSVMPCSGGHEFHPDCIAKWLGQYSNTCPLCRHALPTGADDQGIELTEVLALHRSS